MENSLIDRLSMTLLERAKRKLSQQSLTESTINASRIQNPVAESTRISVHSPPSKNIMGPPDGATSRPPKRTTTSPIEVPQSKRARNNSVGRSTKKVSRTESAPSIPRKKTDKLNNTQETLESSKSDTTSYSQQSNKGKSRAGSSLKRPGNEKDLSNTKSRLSISTTSRISNQQARGISGSNYKQTNKDTLGNSSKNSLSSTKKISKRVAEGSNKDTSNLTYSKHEKNETTNSGEESHSSAIAIDGLASTKKYTKETTAKKPSLKKVQQKPTNKHHPEKLNRGTSSTKQTVTNNMAAKKVTKDTTNNKKKTKLMKQRNEEEDDELVDSEIKVSTTGQYCDPEGHRKDRDFVSHRVKLICEHFSVDENRLNDLRSSVTRPYTRIPNTVIMDAINRLNRHNDQEMNDMFSRTVQRDLLHALDTDREEVGPDFSTFDLDSIQPVDVLSFLPDVWSSSGSSSKRRKELLQRYKTLRVALKAEILSLNKLKLKAEYIEEVNSKLDSIEQLLKSHDANLLESEVTRTHQLVQDIQDIDQEISPISTAMSEQSSRLREYPKLFPN